MNHKENYGKLYNTLSGVETKGANTLIMSDCLRFLEQCIGECTQAEAQAIGKGEENVCHQQG